MLDLRVYSNATASRTGLVQEMKPIAYDLYCGLGGWTEGFLSEGYECIGYDIEKHDYGTGTYPGTLILCDVRSIHGSQLKDAACIVASPPCQEPSYRAMPWSRAKALNAIGPPHLFIELFNSCFRIQREASEAAGHYIPLVIENVQGAQAWVGKAQAHFGSYYLWGNVGQVGNRIIAGTGRLRMDSGLRAQGRTSKVPGFRFDGSGGSFQSACVAFKSQGMNWSDRTKRGQDFTRLAGRHCGTKQGGDWFGKNCESSMSRLYGSKSKKRKAASAEIAKIPFPLAQHIARCFKPRQPQIVTA